MQSFLVSLLIAGILACPYQCAAKSAAARSSDQNFARPTCCQKCQRQAAHASESPAAPAKQKQNEARCWCDGIVFDLSGRQVVDDTIESSWNLVSVGNEAVATLSPIWADHIDDAPPLPGGGADVRVLYQSFLL